MRMRILLVAALIVTLAGCRAPTATPPPALQLDGTEWHLQTINGEALVAGSAISLDLADGRLGGTSGCNHYGGEYSVSAAGDLSLGMIAQTVMLCLDDAVMKQESAYMAALQSATTARLDAEARLELRGEKGTLLYVQRLPAAMNPAQLVGTAWRLTRLAGDTPIGDIPITLAFAENGEIRGNAGCRGYTGRYEAEGDRIGFPFLSMTETECRGSQAVAYQESAFTDALGQAHNYRLRENALEIDTVRGQTLVFEVDSP